MGEKESFSLLSLFSKAWKSLKVSWLPALIISFVSGISLALSLSFLLLGLLSVGGYIVSFFLSSKFSSLHMLSSSLIIIGIILLPLSVLFYFLYGIFHLSLVKYILSPQRMLEKIKESLGKGAKLGAYYFFYTLFVILLFLLPFLPIITLVKNGLSTTTLSLSSILASLFLPLVLFLIIGAIYLIISFFLQFFLFEYAETGNIIPSLFSSIRLVRSHLLKVLVADILFYVSWMLISSLITGIERVIGYIFKVLFAFVSSSNQLLLAIFSLIFLGILAVVHMILALYFVYYLPIELWKALKGKKG